ncbi:MAG: hypothetical protein U0798_01930 [Gemmataceae bacterium]
MSSFLDRFSQAGLPQSGPPAGLQLLLDRPCPADESAIAEAVRLFHPDLSQAVVEWVDAGSFPLPPELGGEGPPAKNLGLVSWGRHIIKLAGFDEPMPPGPLSRTLAHTLFVPASLKAVAQEHKAHLLFDYAGSDPDPLNRFTALAAVVGALANFGGIVALNEESRACVPAAALQPEDDREDILDVLRQLPLPYLYTGFAKMELSDPPGKVWYRTFLNSRFGLPNLARTGTHEEFTSTFQLFSALSNYLRETQLDVLPGETIRVDEERFFVARSPNDKEWYLDSEEGITLVLENG